jgi:ATP-dependent Lhr-like helicase
VTREAVASEAIEGGFSAVYPILRALEEAGRIRRGYFVEGLGAAQFAQGGAIDRLRAAREPAPSPYERVGYVLAAADPGNPYGAAVPWPRRGEDDRRPFQRAAGAYVVIVDGEAVVYVDRGGTSLQTLRAWDDPELARAAASALATLVGSTDARFRELVIGKIDGQPVAESSAREPLLEAGFVRGYRGLVLRPSGGPGPWERASAGTGAGPGPGRGRRAPVAAGRR